MKWNKIRISYICLVLAITPSIFVNAGTGKPEAYYSPALPPGNHGNIETDILSANTTPSHSVSGRFIDIPESNSHEREMPFSSPRGDGKGISMVKNNQTSHSSERDQTWIKERLKKIGLGEYSAIEVPRDFQCWQHVLHRQVMDMDEFGYGDIKDDLIKYIEKLLTQEQETVLDSNDLTSLLDELKRDELPSFDVLALVIAAHFNRTVIVVNLETEDYEAMNDQVFFISKPGKDTYIRNRLTQEELHGGNPLFFAWLMSEKHYLSLIRTELQGNEACSICLSPFMYLEEIHATTCYHYFHRQCLMNLITVGERSTEYHCPLCRTKQGLYSSERCGTNCIAQKIYLSPLECSIDALALHSLCSKGKLNTTCGCGRSFKTATRLYSHRRSRSDIRCKGNLNTTCGGCGRSFETVNILISHRLYSSDDRCKEELNIACGGCGRSFETVNILISHRRSSSDTRCKGKQNTICGCGLNFETVNQLNSHRRGSSDARCKGNLNTNCGGCGRSFETVNQLNSHRRSSGAGCKGKLNTTCPCGQRFMTVNQLNSHRRGSSDARCKGNLNTTCGGGGRSFETVNQLNSHRRSSGARSRES